MKSRKYSQNQFRWNSTKIKKEWTIIQQLEKYTSGVSAQLWQWNQYRMNSLDRLF